MGCTHLGLVVNWHWRCCLVGCWHLHHGTWHALTSPYSYSLLVFSSIASISQYSTTRYVPLHSLPPVPSIPLLPYLSSTYLTLHSHTPHLLHPGCSSPPPSELLPHRTCLPCGLDPLVFNNAIVPSSFLDPLLIPFGSSTTNIFVFTSQHHVRYPPHPPHLSQLS